MKQLSLAAVMYETDNDDYLMSASSWAYSALPYIKNQDIYRCSVLPSPNGFGHAFYRPMSGTKLAEKDDPRDEIVFFDSIDYSWSAKGDLRLLPPEGRHKLGYCGIGFADGRAKSLTRQGISKLHKSHATN